MAAPEQKKDAVFGLIDNLLHGPARPGQAFTMPGCNYDKLYGLARRLSARLNADGQDSTPICVCSDDRPTVAAALLATLAAGPELLLPHALSGSALGELHQLTGFTRAIGASTDALPAGVTLIDPGTLEDEVDSLTIEADPDPDRIWLHLFTGGSTGEPQLWSKSPRNLLGEADYLIRRFEVDSNDRIMATVPVLHIYGLLYSLLVPLLASARVVAATPSFPEEIKRQMADSMPTIFASVPVHYRTLRESPPDKGALRLAFSSAGPLAEPDGVAFSTQTGVDLFEIYGSTETGGIATRCRAKGETALTPYDCIQWRIAGHSLDVRSVFLSAALPVRSSGWFTVADRVKAHGQGGFILTGRGDQVVKVGGNRVDLEKVRQAIVGIDGVHDALVLADPVDSGREREIVALVVGSLTVGTIRTALVLLLEPHERPRALHMVDRIPMAATGKIDRRAIATLIERHQLTFQPAGKNVPLDDRRSIQELAAAHHIVIRADCGGMGICAKCRVWVDPTTSVTPPTDAERDGLTPNQLDAGFRLACQATATGSASVTIPDTSAERAGIHGKTDIAGRFALDSPIRRLIVEGDSPDLNPDSHPVSLVDWLAAQVGQPAAAHADMASLRQLSRYHQRLNRFTLVVHDDTGIRRMVEGAQPASLGFAVDLGTTSLAGYLCDLRTGDLLTADACVNPQRRFGEDVISRISHVNRQDDNLVQLQVLVTEGINLLIKRCLNRIGAEPMDIDEVAICGNTTMQQVFAGLHPYGLGVFPYLPLTLTPPGTSAGDHGLDLDPAVPVFLMPVISGFIGGDTLAAILADRPHERSQMTLIVDIGTNGEVVLGNRDGLWATSCATGPALEGAQISCGMRAVSGAIHRVWPDGGQGGLAYDVLGEPGSRPMGVCGSGIIDTIAALHHMGVILPSGRFDESHPHVMSDETGVGRHYPIAHREQTATGSDITVTLKDVRQIQLAKGALCTGIEFLMRRAGVEKIDRTILTGAFGARFNWKNALSIGMLPPIVGRSEVISKDNLAGVGVVKALLDKRQRVEARTLCRLIRFVELAADPQFAVAFAAATAFPKPTV